MSTQHCKACEADKDPSDFYASNKATCKACLLKRQQKARGVKDGGSSTRKKRGPKPGRKGKDATAPPADAAWSRPAGLGFAVQLEVDENTKQTDIRVDQWNATAGDTQRIWLNQSEARELHSWLSNQLGL